ncbi:hypothetical protein FHW68_000361 [Pseudomonas sp. Tn43]|uniref:hypothetical protein n=1 Tax=unclassified Pseudomonas TaxID=196821 RepID=UPI000BAB7259|nr:MULTISPECIES: hypothetical protein [unclassified Pseudomonas]MBB3238889.1 hypothetical protein [Pseudomonas sp. Tn43]PAU51001.1 hypothetical protein BZL43_27150 [Pseudomonas sp. PICF141]
MNNDDRVNDDEAETTPNVPPADTSGKPEDVIETELEDSDAEGINKTHAQELEAEELRRKIAEIERKVADGN